MLVLMVGVAQRLRRPTLWQNSISVAVQGRSLRHLSKAFREEALQAARVGHLTLSGRTRQDLALISPKVLGHQQC